MDMEYCGEYNLHKHTTLKIGPVNAKVVYIDKKEDIEPALDMAKELKLTPYPLGGGSNTIFSDNVVDKYLFLIPRLSSLSVIPDPSASPVPSVIPVKTGIQSRTPLPYSAEIQVQIQNSADWIPASAGMTENTVFVRIDAGLEWDEAVEQTVEMGLSGLETLSLIPGLVGASPVQNIGAYGAEAKDTIHTVHTFDIVENKFKDFSNEECEFEYRNSIFKKNPGRYFIYAVTFSLLKISAEAPPSVPQYKDVISYFETRNIETPSLKEIREAIIEIRKAKLPDPKDTPNAGSYFGNPIVSKETAEAILQRFPNMPMFDFSAKSSPSVIPAEAGIQSEKIQNPNLDSRIRENDKRKVRDFVGHNINKKLFAGWLIDKAGLKGFEKDNFKIHPNHALVIVGNKKGNLAELLEFENYIKQKVFEMFGVELEREPVLVV
jgi:UDP-N-acetylmuramate dehydrogenase